MEKDDVIHTASTIASDLMSVIEIDGEKHPTLKMAISVVSQVMPEIEMLVKDVANKKDPIGSSFELGKKVFEIVKFDNGGSSRISSTKELAEMALNPEMLKTASVSNPYILLIVVALTIIEKDVKKILSVTKDILSFLESEKQSEVEADVKTLSNIVSKYTANCQNEKFLINNHKLALDIQRTARKNLLFYQKRIAELLKNKSITISQSNVKTFFAKLEKEFKYYQMTVQSLSLASFLEIILSGNFQEENVALTKQEIVEASDNYTRYYYLCLDKIKNDSHKTIETNAVKGSGVVTEAIGKLFLKSKKEKGVSVGEKIVSKGNELSEKSSAIENEYIESFEKMKDSNTALFIEKMDELIFIFNKTGRIYCDADNIYLVKD